jgi:transketolase
LAAFVPVRVLEQIKLDLCHANLPVVMLGDGAGLVYSTLGVSHQCGEDIACLRPLPHLSIFSPCDAAELAACWHEAWATDHPSYIRLGKADRPAVHAAPLIDTSPVFTHRPAGRSGDVVIVATGSMVSPCTEFSRREDLACISVPRIKPFPAELVELCRSAKKVIVAEEHAGTGGLWTSLVEHAARSGTPGTTVVESLALESSFTKTGGSWQQALREHRLADDQLEERLRGFVVAAERCGA